METIGATESEELVQTIFNHLADDRSMLQQVAAEVSLTPDDLKVWMERVRITASSVTL